MAGAGTSSRADQKLEHLMPEVQTDAEWQAAVLSEQAKKCLIVVDVWPDWSGRCEPMRSRLIRFKLTEAGAGEDLLLFSANASTIGALARFRSHSEPTFMFLGGGQLVNVYIGCNRRHLLGLIRRELQQERRVQRGKARRIVLPANKLSPAERERQAARKAKDTAVLQEEKGRADAVVRDIRLRQYHAMADHLHNYTVVLFLPHALQQEQFPQLTEALQASWRSVGVHVVRSERLAVSEEAADELFWERRLPQHAALVDSLREFGGQCLALLLRKGPPPPVEQGETPSQQDVREDTGGQGDAPVMTRRASEDDAEEERMRPGLLERIVAETVYGFYPGSASTLGRNDSQSEFFSPVVGGGGSLANTPPVTLSTSPLHSVSPSVSATVGQFRPSTASWVRQSVLNLARAGLGPGYDLGELTAVAEDEAEEWNDHDMAEYEGCSLSSPFDQAWPKELRPVVDSVAAALLRRCTGTGSDSVSSLVLPGVWTPLTTLSKTAAVRVLFDDFAQQFYDPEEPPPPPPPATVICFRASKRREVLETAANFLGDILHMGFFTEDRKLLAETPGQYDALPYKEGRDRLALALSQARGDEPLLELADYGPTYVSPTAKQAKIDVEQLFTGEVVNAPPRLGPPAGEGDADDSGSDVPAYLMFSRQQQAAAPPAPPEPPAHAAAWPRPPGPPSGPPGPPPRPPGPPSGPGQPEEPGPLGVAAVDQMEVEADAARRTSRTPSSAGPGVSGPGTTPSLRSLTGRGSRGSRPRLSGESLRRVASTGSPGSPLPALQEQPSASEVAAAVAADERLSRTPSASTIGKTRSIHSLVSRSKSAYSLGQHSQHSQHSQRLASKSRSLHGVVASRQPSATGDGGSQSPDRARKSSASKDETGSSETLKAPSRHSSNSVSATAMEERSQNSTPNASGSSDTLVMLVDLGNK